MSISAIAQESTLRLQRPETRAPSAQDLAGTAATAALEAVASGDSQLVAVEKVRAAAAPSGGAQLAVSSGPLAVLVRYVPTETITLYVAIQAALGEVKAPAGKKISDADFSSHWIWVAIMVAATLALTLALAFRTQKDAKPRAKFKPPWFDVTAACAAFLVWSLSLPSTPLRDISGYDYTAWNSVLILGGTIVIAVAAYAFGKTVSWNKVLAE